MGKNADISSEFFGAVVNCAVRYCLGQHSYMPTLIMGQIRPWIPDLTGRTLWCMRKDIREHLSSTEIKTTMEEVDAGEWEKFCLEVETEMHRRGMGTNA